MIINKVKMFISATSWSRQEINAPRFSNPLFSLSLALFFLFATSFICKAGLLQSNPAIQPGNSVISFPAGNSGKNLENVTSTPVALALQISSPAVSQAANAITVDSERPLYQSWWFILITLFIFCASIVFLFKNFSTYNSELIIDRSGRTTLDELRLYVLCLGIIAPLSEIYIEAFKLRSESELIVNLLLGAVLLTAYFLSYKSAKIAASLYWLIMLAALGFYVSSVYKIFNGDTNALTITEYFLVLFYSFILFRNTRNYWIYMVIICVFVVIMFFVPGVSLNTALTLTVGSFFIILMNYASHVSHLNKNEKFLFAGNVIHAGNSLTLATNKMGEVLFCSDNIIRILGYSPEEVKGLGFWKLTEDKEFEYIDYGIKFSKDKVYIRKLKCKDGSYKYIQWTDTKHSEDLYVGIGQDVTSELSLRGQYKSLVESATDLIFETDAHGNLTFVNEAVNQMLGYQPAELQGKPFLSLVQEEYVQPLTNFYFRNIPDDNRFELVEFPLMHKDGTELWVSQKVNIQRDNNGAVNGYTSIIRDITKFKNIELRNTRRQEKRNRYNSLLNQLNTNPEVSAGVFENAVKLILQNVSSEMSVDHISLWKIHPLGLECSFEWSDNLRIKMAGSIREKINLPEYFAAINSARTLVANDIGELSEAAELNFLYGGKIKSLLEIPIFSNAELNGVISCETRSLPRIWDGEDINFLRSVAELISVLLETRKRQKIEKQLAFRNEISLAVSQITEKLLVSENIENTLYHNLDIIAESTRSSRVYFYTYSETSQELDLFAEVCAQDITKLSSTGYSRLDASSVKPLWAYVRSNQVFETLKSKTEDEGIMSWLETGKTLSSLVLPVYVKEGLYGVLGFDDCVKERMWSDSHLVILKALVDNITTAVDRVRRELRIKESESNFRQINETIQDVFWLYDVLQKKYIYVSPNSVRIMGISDKEFYDGSYRKRYIIFEEDSDRRKKNQKSLVENDFYEVEYRIRTEEGYRWINEKCSAIRDASGALIRSSGVCRDVTSQKKAESELKQLSVVAKNTSNGVLICNSDGLAVWANDGFLNMFEISMEQLVGNAPNRLFTPPGTLSVSELNALNSEHYTKEMQMHTFLGRNLWVEINSTKIFDERGQVSQQIELMTDITEKVEYRNSLLRYSNDLEFQGTLQQKIINAASYEELTLETLGFIYEQIKGCIRISLVRYELRQDSLRGHALINGKLEKVSFRASKTNSFSTVVNGQTFVMRNLPDFPNKSESDIEELKHGVKSYLVLPLMKENEMVGTLNISFDQELDLAPNQIKNIESFARLYSVALWQLDLKKELSLSNKNMLDSLTYARYIQGAVLPVIKNMTASFSEVSLFFKPRDIVSGDFYWAGECEGLTFVVVADCTGHGVPGAFLTLIGSRILEEIIETQKIKNPAEILKKLDERVYLTLNSKQSEIIRDGMEIALCVIDKPKRKLAFAGAGRGLLYFRDGWEFSLPGNRRLIGDFDREGEEFTYKEMSIEPGDYYYLFSDGFQDQIGGTEGRRFSRNRLVQLLKEILPLTSDLKEERLNSELEKYRGRIRQTDDITVLGLKINIEQ